MSPKNDLLAIWRSGVAAVQGRSSVNRALAAHQIARPDSVVAVGKAAASMAAAVYDTFGEIPTLIVTKHGHIKETPKHASVVQSGHPVPDEASLIAGTAIRDAIAECKKDAHLLFLVSGGASSLAEVLPAGMSLNDLTLETEALLASGQDIHTINLRRKEISQIKGGKAFAGFKGRNITTLAISDVQGDDVGVIGSGIAAVPDTFNFEYTSHIVANNQIARQAAADHAGISVKSNHEDMYDDVAVLAVQIADQLRTSNDGIHILGGEPTVVLPENPGLGGRNMMLASMIAREIKGTKGIRVLVAGTDGTDGPTDAAGALVDGQTWDESGHVAIEQANIAPWLNAKDALIRSGPTGTNVMDLLIAEVRST
jgi:hydroxypyruvate reductase